jgi:ferredoxin
MRRPTRSGADHRRQRGAAATTPGQWRWWSWGSVPASTSVSPIAVVRREFCIGCGRCMSVCPAGVISLDSEQKAVVDRALCRGCGACVEACPVDAIRVTQAVRRSHPRRAKDE